MKNWFRTLDDILRGKATEPAALRDGQINIPVRELTPVLIQLGAFYGFCMGWYAIFNHDDPQYMQIWASMLKVPVLFGATLVVTMPSLYVFNALVGSRLTFSSLIALMTASTAITLAVLAAFGPIVAFFSVTTESYSFMKLFNVLLFALAALLGLRFLLQTLHRVTAALDPEDAPQRSTVRGRAARRPIIRQSPRMATALQDAAIDGDTSFALEHDDLAPAASGSNGIEARREPGALESVSDRAMQKHVKRVFYSWTILFALVGGQMSWVLRPFIGEPGVPFQWFRVRESNFLEAVLESLNHLFR